MINTLQNKIYGSLLAAAVGDAMGSPLEARTTQQIKDDFGNGDFVYDYMSPREHSFNIGMVKGSISDDFSSAYVAAEHFLADNGIVSAQNSMKALLAWKYSEETKLYYEKFSGPSTRISIDRLEGNGDHKHSYLLCNNKQATNGAAMKSWIVGLFNKGDLDQAINNAITMCLPTHKNAIALSGAAAVAAAVARALDEDAEIDTIIEAGLYGAQKGFEQAKKICSPTAGANIARRIDLAVEIGIKNSNDFEKCINEMTGLISTGLSANESVPAAFGYIAASNRDLMKGIHLCINSGNDADTTAIMAGAVLGAFNSADCLDSIHHELLMQSNKFINFNKMTDAIYNLYLY